jgi:hypothetical protein
VIRKDVQETLASLVVGDLVLVDRGIRFGSPVFYDSYSSGSLYLTGDFPFILRLKEITRITRTGYNYIQARKEREERFRRKMEKREKRKFALVCYVPTSAGLYDLEKAA